MRRLSGRARAVLGYTAGCVLTGVGVAVEFGIGMGLIVGGVVCAASFFALADFDEEGGR